MQRDDSPASRGTPRLLLLLAAIVLAAGFGVRVFYLFAGEFNEDEMNTLQMAWQYWGGVTPYLDTFAFRPPLSFYLLRPLFALFEKPSHLILAARAVQLVLASLTCLFYFLFVDRLAGRRAAWWSLILICTFNFFVIRTTQIRAEPLMLMLMFAGLWMFARLRSGAAPLWHALAAGLLLGGAVMTKYSAPFIALAPTIVLAGDVIARRGARRAALASIALYVAGGVAAILGIFALVTGTDLLVALERIWLAGHGLRFSESYRAPSWFVLRTFVTNAPFWAAAAIGFVYLHGRLLTAWRNRQPAWQFALLIALGWLALAMLPARQKFFQQDLILPGLLMAPGAAVLLVRRLPRAVRLRSAGGVAALAVSLVLLGSFALDVGYQRYQARRTLGFHTQVLGEFWGAKTPPPQKVNVEVLPLLAFFAGKHDWIKYFPVRTFGQSLALADRITQLADPGELVLSQAGHAIVRAEPLKVIKTQVFADFMKFEAKRSHPLCRALRPFMPAACDETFTPGRRALQVLTQHPPQLIVFDYAVADLLAKQPETWEWVAENYRMWFEPATLTFFAKPAG